MRSQSKSTLPLPAQRALKKLGANVREARLRRRISTEVMAQRALISRMTLNKVEKGDPSVSMGIYTTVFFVLGMSDRLGDLIDLKHDSVGLRLAEASLPKRIRQSKVAARKKPRKPSSEISS